MMRIDLEVSSLYYIGFQPHVFKPGRTLISVRSEGSGKLRGKVREDHEVTADIVHMQCTSRPKIETQIV